MKCDADEVMRRLEAGEIIDSEEFHISKPIRVSEDCEGLSVRCHFVANDDFAGEAMFIVGSPARIPIGCYMEGGGKTWWNGALKP